MIAKRGTRLIPSLIDEIAKQDPNRVFAGFALDPAFQNVQNITFHQLATAIDRFAGWVLGTFGSSTSFETICFLGVSTVRNFVFVIGALKAGYKLLLFDHNSSREICDSLLAATKCGILLTDEDPLPVVRELEGRSGLRSIVAPDIQHLLQNDPVEHIPFQKTYEEARLEPFVVLTTSGSTGLPKPVTMSHGTMTPHDLLTSEALPDGPRMSLSLFDGHRILLGPIMSHSAGLCFVAYSLYAGVVPILPPPGILTAEIANAAHASGQVKSSWLIPPTLVDLCRRPEYLENLRLLSYIGSGGLAIPQAVGETVSKYTHLNTLFGATETGYYALEATEPEDWQYVRPTKLLGAAFREVGPEAFQLVFERTESLRLHQGMFATFPELQEYDTKDIYRKHPSKDGLWLYQGRADLLVVLASRLKIAINPLPYEAAIDNDPNVRTSLFCGYGRPVAALLIEAASSPASAEEEMKLLEAIWPTVERANLDPKNGRGHIAKELVVFTSPAKPMLRALKGSVQRKETLAAYTQEIDDAYARWEAVSKGSS